MSSFAYLRFLGIWDHLSPASERMIPKNPHEEERQDAYDQPEDEGIPPGDIDCQKANPNEPSEYESPDEG